MWWRAAMREPGLNYELARDILLTMIWWGWVGSDVVESSYERSG